MQHPDTPDTTEQTGQTYCLRHPETESNLRCGRCNDLICPRCLVTSPVGSRCPSCARIGRPAILDTSATEMGRAIIFAAGAGILGALGLSIVLWVLVSLPFVITIIDFAVIAGGMAGIGYLVGEAVRFGSGKKIDKRLKYVAAGGVFISWLAIAALLPVFNVSANFIVGFGGIVGLVIAFYIATSRVRI